MVRSIGLMRFLPPFSWRWLWQVFSRLLLGAFAFLALVLLALIFVNPPFSSEMLRERFHGRPVTQQWVPLEKISPYLIKAVVMSEDGQFCRHWGVDWRQVRVAWTDSQAGAQKPRGASTITMQLVKNLFLWSERSYIRKAIEVPLAHLVSFSWSKRRQMELYLNIVEWAPGVYGAEAAARHHFKRSAQLLSPRQAALLAASLPNPIVRRAGKAGPHTRRIAAIVQKRMGGARPWVRCIYK